MNHQIPSVEDFLAQPDPAEDDLEPLTVGPGGVWQFPPLDLTGYVAEISASLKAIAEATRIGPERAGQDFTAELASTDEGEAVQTLTEEVADLRADRAELAEVIDRIEAALGKSKAAPALAAKAVIDAWRNPQVPEAAEGESTKYVDEDGEPLAEWEQEMLAAQADPPSPDIPAEHLPGHTRTPHPEGPDFCRECSGEQQEWVGWPCPTITDSFNPLGAPVEPEAPQKAQQPEHNAPVEEWREYARALGFAGPEIDKANRSVIRTTLGIAQPGTD